MKIRTGYVSNSSTSSFLAFGFKTSDVYGEITDYDKFYDNITKLSNKINKEYNLIFKSYYGDKIMGILIAEGDSEGTEFELKIPEKYQESVPTGFAFIENILKKEFLKKDLKFKLFAGLDSC